MLLGERARRGRRRGGGATDGTPSAAAGREAGRRRGHEFTCLQRTRRPGRSSGTSRGPSASERSPHPWRPLPEVRDAAGTATPATPWSCSATARSLRDVFCARKATRKRCPTRRYAADDGRTKPPLTAEPRKQPRVARVAQQAQQRRASARAKKPPGPANRHRRAGHRTPNTRCCRPRARSRTWATRVAAAGPKVRAPSKQEPKPRRWPKPKRKQNTEKDSANYSRRN